MYRLTHLYQLVDKSTYTSSSSITLKSLMPICVKRNSLKTENFTDATILAKDENSDMEFVLPVYNVFVFRKEIPIILFYLANGLDWALSYLGVDNIIKFVEEPDPSRVKDNLYFQISSKCLIEVNKEMFLKYTYIQAIVGMILHVSTNRISIEDLYNKNIWIKKLSNNNTLQKGKDILVFFNRLMDKQNVLSI